MTFNTAGYIIFGFLVYFITFHVGLVFYRNGKIYMQQLFNDDIHLVDAINKLLLVGYYLLNLGYTTLSIVYWPHIASLSELVECVTYNAGVMIVILGLMHYINMLGLLMYSYSQHKNKNKNKQTFH